MDADRRWAIETFGEFGAHIRGRVAELVRDEHLAMTDAQAASGHRGQDVYGQFWRGIHQRFEEFANLSHATLIRPGKAPYRIPVINGVALVPWRWNHSRGGDLASVRFATSEARLAMFELQTPATQGKFEIGMPDPGLGDDEKELARLVEEAIGERSVTANKVVVVAISSSTLGLHEMRWGEVRLAAAGYLEWRYTQDLANVTVTGPVGVVNSGKSFTAGDIPMKDLRHRLEADTDSGVSASGDD